MAYSNVKLTINAPVDVVFDTISDINNFKKAVPNVIDAEIISEIKSGVGTRFRETRMIQGKEATTEIEVTEFTDNESIRMVADAGGTIWDSFFAVTRHGDKTTLELTMDARPYKFSARLVTPMLKNMLQKAVEKDMNAVKTYCEK